MKGCAGLAALVAAALLAAGLAPAGSSGAYEPRRTMVSVTVGAAAPGVAPNSTAVGNFTAAIQRLVTLVGLSGGGLLALVWTRVALSWFSNDITKKVQAKERARDALVGTLLFTAALTGLIWGLAHWVLTGS